MPITKSYSDRQLFSTFKNLLRNPDKLAAAEVAEITNEALRQMPDNKAELENKVASFFNMSVSDVQESYAYTILIESYVQYTIERFVIRCARETELTEREAWSLVLMNRFVHFI